MSKVFLVSAYWCCAGCCTIWLRGLQLIPLSIRCGPHSIGLRPTKTNSPICKLCWRGRTYPCPRTNGRVGSAMLRSQLLRPNDRVRFHGPNYALAPLAGLQIEAGAVSIGDQLLVRCNRAEWESVEDDYLFKSWHSQYYEANPVFLYQPVDELSDANGAEAILDELGCEAARVISAMRLY